DKKRNIKNIAIQDFILKQGDDLDKYFQVLKLNYVSLYENFISKNEIKLKHLLAKCHLISYVVEVDEEINNYRIFLVSKNRVFLIGSARNKKCKIDFSSYIIDFVIQKFSLTNHY